MKSTHPIGALAEQRALTFLQQQGCTLVARNWHCAYGEIDLIMRLNNILLFVEVKYRKNQQFGGAVHSIGTHKLAKLQKSIEHYLQQNDLDCPCRLDAVLIEGNNTPVWLNNITG